MKCNKFRDIIITDHVDGELDEQGKQELASHLQECAGCREFAAAVLAVAVDPLRKTTPEEPPAFLWTRLQSRLEQEQRNHSGLKWLQVLATSAMFLAMVLTGNYLVSGMVGTTNSQEVVASSEVASQLSLSEFNDMPNEQVETVYNNIIGG